MSIEGRWRYKQWIKHSDQWDEMRSYALGFEKMKCQGCEKVDPKNHAHHIFYPNGWEKTKRQHLRVLCKNCHELVHQLTTPNVYTTLDQARLEFFGAINEIRESNNLSPLTRPEQTVEGEIRRDEFLARRKKKLHRYADELGVI